jgi:hypothetical protein
MCEGGVVQDAQFGQPLNRTLNELAAVAGEHEVFAYLVRRTRPNLQEAGCGVQNDLRVVDRPSALTPLGERLAMSGPG